MLRLTYLIEKMNSNRLLKEVEDLEAQLFAARKELRRSEVQMDSLREMTGVADPDAQWTALEKCVRLVATHPRLTAKTLNGKVSELERLLSAPETDKPEVDDVPSHLRPPNYNRIKAVRLETAEGWNELLELRQSFDDVDRIDDERWNRWVTNSGTLKDLKHKVAMYGETLVRHSQIASDLDEKVELLGDYKQSLPQRFFNQINDHLEKFLDFNERVSSTREYDHDRSVEHALMWGFVQEFEGTDWEKKGKTKEEWSGMNEIQRIQAKDIEYGDFWHINRMLLASWMLEGKTEILNELLQELKQVALV